MDDLLPKYDTDVELNNDSIIKNIIKIREEHAKKQRKDYSHVFRSKSRFDFIRLSCIVVGIELAYAAETAFVSPILLQIGIQHEHMTMVWGLSPLLGFFFGPLLGSISDRCRLQIGRRRPIILMLSLAIFCGLLLVPYGKELGIFIADSEFNYTTTKNIALNVSNYQNEGILNSERIEHKQLDLRIAVVFTIIGAVILDFSADTCQGPSRAYLLDVSLPDEHAKALSTFTTMAGFGGTLGYALGGIDWELTKIGEFLGGNIPTVFTLVTLIFVICVTITITSFREIPMPLIETDELLRPLTIEAIEKHIYKNDLNSHEEYKILRKKDENEEMQENFETENDNGEYSEDDFESISFRKYLKSIIVMPKSMRMLCLTNLLTWMAHLCYCLYFTDFVGEAVFGGDPSVEAGKEKNEIYENGVRFGCWGLSIYAFSCSIYSISVEKLIKFFGVKWVYIGGLLSYAIGMLILAIFPTKTGVLILSITAGILYSTLFTFPYILIAQYHAKQCFKMKNGQNVRLVQPRGLGTDIAVVSSMVFVGQIIVSMTMGSLITWMNSTCAVIYSASAYSLLAAISALFVLYLD